MHVIVFSEMNRCSKNIHPRANSDSNLPWDRLVLFHRCSWPWRRRLPCNGMGLASNGGSGSMSLLYQPAKICTSFNRTWEVDAASNEFELILLSGFTEAVDIPKLLDAIGLDAAEELVGKNQKTCSSLLVATWTQPFLHPFDLVSSSPVWSKLTSWNSW